MISRFLSYFDQSVLDLLFIWTDRERRWNMASIVIINNSLVSSITITITSWNCNGNGKLEWKQVRESQNNNILRLQPFKINGHVHPTFWRRFLKVVYDSCSLLLCTYAIHNIRIHSFRLIENALIEMGLDERWFNRSPFLRIWHLELRLLISNWHVFKTLAQTNIILITCIWPLSYEGILVLTQFRLRKTSPSLLKNDQTAEYGTLGLHRWDTPSRKIGATETKWKLKT